jgi:Zn-dependent metalloprotease
MVKQHALKQSADQADWLIGAELLARGVRGRALRDMLNPGTAYDDPNLGRDPQPNHMSRYVQTREDNGGVHINSGIPNRAFALAAKAVGGNSWEGAGQVWYRTLLTLGNPQADFSYFARQTVRAAGDLFGQGSKQQQAVEAAWSEVGVT